MWRKLTSFLILSCIMIAHSVPAIAQTQQPAGPPPDYWPGPWFMWSGGWSSWWWICPLMMIGMMLVMMFACRFMCSWHRDHI
jgi:hypothetical protein